MTAGQTFHADATLQVADKSEQVEVTADRVHGEAEAINRERTALNILQVLPAEVITSLPNANVADAIGRLPSVTLEIATEVLEVCTDSWHRAALCARDYRWR